MMNEIASLMTKNNWFFSQEIKKPNIFFIWRQVLGQLCVVGKEFVGWK